MVSLNSVYSQDFLDVPSDPSISSSTAFSGDITFTIQQPSNECYIIGKQSYFSIGLQIVQVREDSTLHTLEPIINVGAVNARTAPQILSVPYLTQNVAGALFQNINCNLKGEQISSFQYAGQVNTLYKMMYESDAEQKSINSTSPINPLRANDCGVTKGAVYDDCVALSTRLTTGGVDISGMLSKHQIWALKNQQLGFDKYNINKIIF